MTKQQLSDLRKWFNENWPEHCRPEESLLDSFDSLFSEFARSHREGYLPDSLESFEISEELEADLIPYFTDFSEEFDWNEYAENGRAKFGEYLYRDQL